MASFSSEKSDHFCKNQIILTEKYSTIVEVPFNSLNKCSYKSILQMYRLFIFHNTRDI